MKKLKDLYNKADEESDLIGQYIIKKIGNIENLNISYTTLKVGDLLKENISYPIFDFKFNKRVNTLSRGIYNKLDVITPNLNQIFGDLLIKINHKSFLFEIKNSKDLFVSNECLKNCIADYFLFLNEKNLGNSYIIPNAINYNYLTKCFNSFGFYSKDPGKAYKKYIQKVENKQTLNEFLKEKTYCYSKEINQKFELIDQLLNNKVSV